MDGEAGWWTTRRNIGLPPLASVMGVGRQQHEWISAQLWHCIQRLATDAGLREGFELNVGLHQRSVMSPLLFAVVFDIVSIEARSGLLSELLYADDLVRMAPTMEQLGRSVAEWRVSLLD